MSTNYIVPALDTTAQAINQNLNLIAHALAGQSDGSVKSHSMAQAVIRAGLVKNYFTTGDLYKVYKESGVSVTFVGDAITAVTVDDAKFIEAVDSSRTFGYEFIFDGAAWHLDGVEAELSVYGVTVTGTPSANDILVVHVQASTLYAEVLDTDDFDVPTNPELTHTLPLLFRDILWYGTLAFCSPQMMKVIEASEFANGMPAGTYTFSLDHSSYANNTVQDGDVHFTTTQAIPVGGGIRHSAIGVYQSSYTRAQILAGTFTTYDASGEVIESGLATADGAEGTNIGTVTAESATYMSGTGLNLTRRQAHGSNEYANSYMRMWITSDAKGAAEGQVASWYTKLSKFDRPIKSTMPGFLYGMDPEFVKAICPVRKRTYLHPFDRTTDKKYKDTEETVWQISMTEMGYGNNDGIDEGGVKADGTINRAGAYALYDGASNADRIKYEGSTKRVYFLRSPHPSSAYGVRSVDTSGALNNYFAYYAYGVVAGLCIG